MASDPTRELGNASNGIAPWSSFTHDEDVTELAFPNSVWTYGKIRNDEQVAGLLLAFTLPIRGYQRYIDSNGARDEVVEDTARDLNLPIDGESAAPAGRLKRRFGHDDHLRQSLLDLTYGFMFFEQVYFLGTDQKFHLRKLGPRFPGSISEIVMESDGGLKYIKQYPTTNTTPSSGESLYAGAWAPEIFVDRLFAYVNDKGAATGSAALTCERSTSPG